MQWRNRPIQWGVIISCMVLSHVMTSVCLGQEGVLGYVKDTKFSVHRGFYDKPFSVTITTETADALIFYTTDGSDPTTSGSAVHYTSPISVTGTTCLRAFAMKPGWRSTDVDTQTYLFLADVITFSQGQALSAGYPATWFSNYPGDYAMDPDVTGDPDYRDQMEKALRSLPTLSLVTDKDNLFNKDKYPDTGGIYIYTGHSSTGGQDWERPVSAEFFDVNGAEAFHVNCGLRIQGGESRNPPKMPKHSFSLRFREQYGSGKLNYPLFKDWPVDFFDSLQLRAFFNNTWAHWAPDQRERATYIRDQWMRDALTAMGQQDAGQGFYIHLYINGMYWGLYNLEERPDEDHYAAYHGGDPDTIDAINGGRATNGSTQAWNHLKQVVQQQDWEQIKALMDVNNFIDFMMANLYSGNQDLKTNGNWRAAGGGVNQRPWRFYAWDSEHIMENVNHTHTSPSQDPTGLWNSLCQIKAFRDRFADRAHQYLFNNGPLTPGPAADRFNARVHEIETAVIAESARWGDYRRDMHSYKSGPYYLYTRDDFWIPEVDKLLTQYFPQRTDRVIQLFQSMGLYPTIAAPTFWIDGKNQYGGAVDTGRSLSMQAEPGSTIYYTLDGTDPRVNSGDSESPTESIRTYTAPLPLAQSGRVKARTTNGSEWSALSDAVYSVGPIARDLRISAIMYHPVDANAEYIELANIGPETLNLNLVRLSRGVRFTFPSMDLEPQARCLVVRDRPTFTATYGQGWRIAGQYEGSLDNDGERITLEDAAGTVILDFTYDDDWYKTTDGKGASLTVIDPVNTDPNAWSDKTSWRASN